MTAPYPSPAEQAVIDRFEAAEAAPESYDRRYPCYCLPGPARCDTLGEHFDRAAALGPSGAAEGAGR